MKYQLIVFDWDGTLYDSVGHIVAGVQQGAEVAGLPAPTAHQARHVIGMNFDMAIHSLFPEITREQMKQFKEFYKEYHRDTGDIKPQLFEGAREVLDELKAQQYALAVITGKGRTGLDEDLKTFQVEHIFDATRCGDEGPSKPHPQLMHEVLEELLIEPERALMVGDTEYDLNLAKNAGAHSVGVTYGVHSKEILHACGPQHCIDDIRELLNFLKR